jgi:hypothetical protein
MTAAGMSCVTARAQLSQAGKHMQRPPVRKLTCLVLTAGMLGAGAVGLAAAPASATTTTVIVGSGSVAPGNPGGQWGLEPGAGTGTYGFVSGPLGTPGGTGSLALGIATGQHESFFNYSYGACTNPPTCSAFVPANATPIGNIDTLGYSVYRTSGTSYPTFNIEVNSAGTTGFTSFVFIPNAGSIPNNTWHTWNPMDPSQGAWWSSHALTTAPFNCAGFACSATWSQITTGFPSAVVLTGLGPNVGTDSNFAGNVDNVTVGVSGATKVYDFEPNCTTTCYVNSSTGSDFATGLAGDPLKTIQAGVNTVSPGGTVSVAAGTYTENVTVPKSVDITGAGAGATIVEPAVANPNCNGVAGMGSLCSPPGNTASNVFLIQASNVTIDHLTVDGHNPALSGPANDGGVYAAARNGIIEDYNVGPSFNNTSVHDVTVQNIYLRGIYASSSGTGFNFTNDVVTNVQGDPTASIAIFNFGGSGIITGNHVSNSNGGIQSNWSSGTSYTNNVVTTSASGVESDNNGGFGGTSTADTISGNTVSACTTGGYGVTVFVPYLNASVTNNTVSGCDNGLVALASCDLSGTNSCPGSVIPTTTYSDNTITDTAGGKGLYITTNSMGFGDGEVHVNADHNTISGPGIAAYVEETGTAHATTAITRNALTAATNTGATTVNGTCNWWGQNTGPAAGQVTGPINTTSWLASSDLNGLCAGAPSAPTITGVYAGPTPDPAPTSVDVAFTPPSSGNPITSYTATCVGLNESPTGPPAGPTGTASGPTSPILINGLALRGAYQCTVTATNAFGTSPPSAPFFVFLGGTGNCSETPTAPAMLSTGPGNASATVSWAPATGNCIAGYVVTPYLGGIAQPAKIIPGHGTTTVMNGLTNGASYTFTVAAENGAAAGPASEMTGPITAGAPSAVTALHVTRVAKGALKIAFHAPAGNGAPITGYTATCNSSNQGASKGKVAKASPFTVSGLSAGKVYRCTVKATNKRGTGPASHPSAAIKA